MILIDTSAWVEYLRGTGSPAALSVRRLLATDEHIATCDAVVMEVLAGGRSEEHVAELRRLLARATLLRVTPTDWEDAARLYRSGRRQGVTVRKLLDCLIAAVGVRADATVLHHDADFDPIATVSTLRVSRA